MQNSRAYFLFGIVRELILMKKRKSNTILSCHENDLLSS